MIKPGAMLGEVLKHAGKKPATHGYPFVKFPMPDKFRGKLTFFQDKCIGCKICERDCPSIAIHITKKADKVFDCMVNLDRCLYCGQCVESCPKRALEQTVDFELAGLTRAGLSVQINDKNSDVKPG